jgi:glycosyltransferase involved in cell wall biosynthesis
VISDAGPHPYFRTLIEAGGLDRDSVIVGCAGPAGPLQDEMRQLGVRSFALGAERRADYPMAAVRLARLLRGWRAAVVQSHLVDGSLVGLSAARLARVPVVVFTAHHSHELPFHGRKLVAVDRLCAGALSDHVIAPSRDVAETLVRLAHADPERIAVVHHGFDLARFDPARNDREAARRQLGVEGKLVFGAVGRIYRLKNQLALVDAFAEALGGAADARLVIAGPGDADPVRRRALQLGIADRIVLAGPSGDVPALLSGFDVFVHPALAESFGMVIIEAMAAARPIVSTPVGIAPEVVQTGVTGVLCDSAQADSLAGGLRRILAERERWPDIGAAARSRVAGFTARAMTDEHSDLYASWLGDRLGC